MDLIRLFIVAFIMVALIFLGALVFDPMRGQDAAGSVRAELQSATNSADLTHRVEDSLARGDYDEAAMYADIAGFAGMPLAPDTEARLADQNTQDHQIAQGGGFVDGLAAGRDTSTTALAGAVASDLTVIGDIRDISAEGARMAQGQGYDELVLGLSMVGVSLTNANITSGGSALPAKVGVSILKVAAHAGILSADFSDHLRKLVGNAVDIGKLRDALHGVDLTNASQTRAVAEAYAQHVETAKVFPTLAKLEIMRSAAGAGETVRLLKFVKNSDELDDVVNLTRVLGPKTRGIVEITGKASLRHFKHPLNGVSVLLQNLASVVAWLGSLTTLFFSRRMFRMVGV